MSINAWSYDYNNEMSDTLQTYISFKYFLKGDHVLKYNRYRPQIVSSLSNIGGLIALLKIGAILNIINWFFFTKEAAKDNLTEAEGPTLQEKFSFEKMN